jgi:hypothetical protein
MMWIYWKRDEHELVGGVKPKSFCVGWLDPFMGSSVRVATEEYNTQEEARNAVHYLNGGSHKMTSWGGPR